MKTSAVDAYDAIADRFDRLEIENRILAHMRRETLQSLLAILPKASRILEIGCGSGAEATEVARTLHADVVACEPAPRLAEIARKRAAAAGASVVVRTEAATEFLGGLARRGDRFDGGWASFSLGYEADTLSLVRLLAKVLRPGAPFACSFRNPWPVLEPWTIPVRLSGKYLHKVGNHRVALRHLAPRAAKKTFAPHFLMESVRGLCVFVPPPRYGRLWNRLGPLAAAMEVVDARWSRRGPFRTLGDHSLFIFRRDAT